MVRKFINLTNHDLVLSGPNGGTKIFRPKEYSYDTYYSRYVGKDRMSAVSVDETILPDKDRKNLANEERIVREREGLRSLLSHGTVLGRKVAGLAQKGIPIHKLASLPKKDLDSLNLTRSDLTLFEKAKTLYDDGKSFSEIASMLGLTAKPAVPVVLNTVIAADPVGLNNSQGVQQDSTGIVSVGSVDPVETAVESTSPSLDTAVESDNSAPIPELVSEPEVSLMGDMGDKECSASLPLVSFRKDGENFTVVADGVDVFNSTNRGSVTRFVNKSFPDSATSLQQFYNS